MKKIIILVLILIVFAAANTLKIEDCSSQWYQQTLPGNYGGIYCLKFWNQYTGWMSTGGFDSIYHCKILKTTNGGDNWFMVKDSIRMYNFQLVDSVTIYGNGRTFYHDMIYRTFNGGNTWDSVSNTSNTYHCVYFFNKDTGYIGASDGDWGYLLKTTNSGVTLNQIYRDDNPYFGFDLTFFNEKVNNEYYGYCNSNIAGALYKTTNSGNNWVRITNGLYDHVGSYYFINKDTGWISNYNNGHINYIQHTTNGGISFINQFTTLFNNHYSGNIYFSSYYKGWAGSSDGNMVFATTDGGQNWGRQYAPQYRTGGLFFLDSLTGWCYSWQISKTTNGGGVIIGITKDSSINSIPKSYTLKQNYPNPFNGSTIIEYSITKKATIGINIYDITGRSVYDMTANNQEPGNYKLKIDFGPLYLPSGVYFYNFKVVNGNREQQYSETKRMIYMK